MDFYNASVQALEPKLCAKGCGFFGSPLTLNFCSKCFREEQLNVDVKKLSIHEETSMELPVVESPVVVPVQDKCQMCKKRVRLTRGFKCKCGNLFCESHRYPEEHRCTFNYRASGKYEIAKANPSMKADKLEKI